VEEVLLSGQGLEVHFDCGTQRWQVVAAYE